MQANTLTLSVDLLDTAVYTDVDFDRYEEHLNRSVYKTGESNLVSRDLLGLFRSMPNSNGNYAGTAKSSAKFTLDVEVPGIDSTTTVKAPLIGEISFSAPVGVTPAMMLVLRQRLVALAKNATIMTKLMDNLEV